MSGETSTCVECPETIGVGPSGCRLVGRGIAGCAVVDYGLCSECVEWMYSAFTECLACGDDVCRCTNTTALLCADAHVPDAAVCTPTDDKHITALWKNHAVKCADFTSPDGAACTPNDDTCVETRGGVCITCNNATLVASSGAECVRDEAWTALSSTHSPLVCGDRAFFSSGTCVSCTNLYGGACSVCDERGCIDCGGAHVVEGGICRSGALCSSTDGRMCTSCEDGAVPFNATDCTALGDCVVFEDGVCVKCADGLALVNGTCQREPGCIEWSDDRCLRCKPGMYESGNVCESCNERCATCSRNATTCLSCDVRRGLFLASGTCKDNADLIGICTVFINDGGGGVR